MRLLKLSPACVAHLRTYPWRILITGASGWLGQAALELLTQSLGPESASRVLAFGSTHRLLRLRNGITVPQHPLTTLAALPPQPSLLLHFAYLTREKTSQMTVEDYATANRQITRLALEGGQAVGMQRAFLVSSGAVHAALAAPDDPAPALQYGRLKLEDESLFHSFAHADAAHRVFTARLFNLSGPYINKIDAYALASFIQQARSGQITVHATHPVLRSYTSVENLLHLAFEELLADEANRWTCVETAGDHVVEMAELADAVRTVVNPTARIQRAPLDQDAHADRYVGDGLQYRQLLTRYGIALHPLTRQIADTDAYLSEAEAQT